MRFVALSGCLVLCSLLFMGCNRSGAGPASPTTQSEATTAAMPASTPIAITAADLQKLKWIEGTWRGTGVVQKPFYERYKFEDASLVMEELADEAASTVNRTTRYELKDGKFGNERYVATALDDKSITFSPLTAGRNSFRWQSESKDAWTAILTQPATTTTPAKETVYKMERIK